MNEIKYGEENCEQHIHRDPASLLKGARKKSVIYVNDTKKQCCESGSVGSGYQMIRIRIQLKPLKT